MELETNYAQIKEIVDTSPSLRAAFSRILDAGLVTVKYDAFARTWKKVCAARAKKAEQTSQPQKNVGNTAPAQKERKPLPAVTPPFKMASGSEVDKAW